MRTLFDSVLAWGEKLVYSGIKDDTLPPNVLKALDEYLAESNSKLLVVLPLRDERETNTKKPPRSVLLLECFDPPAGPEQMVARLEVVGKHATAALYNASEYRRIPMRFLWFPLAKLQDGLGGKARAILTLIGVAVVLLIGVLVLVPYPLKMEASGQLLPRDRSYLYSSNSGTVREIKGTLKSGSQVVKDQQLLRLFDMDLDDKITDMKLKIDTADNTIKLSSQLKEGDKSTLAHEINEAKIRRDAYSRQLEDLQQRTNAILQRPGEFWVRAPMSGIILTGDFRDTLLNRPIKPNEALLQIGKVDMKNPKLSEWEIELKIPQKHIGQVLAAYGHAAVNDELDVDLLLTNMPTSTFKAKLHRSKIAKEARAKQNREQKDDPGGESEPMVMAWARISGNDIPEESRIPLAALQTSNIEVHTRIRCGNHAMGYSLFYGVWEFLYEKVVWFF